MQLRNMSKQIKNLIFLIVVLGLSFLQFKLLASNGTKAEYESSSTNKEWIPKTPALNTITFNEPFANRWQRRFSNSEARNKSGRFLFFKHIRKAGGTTLRDYFEKVFEYHNNSRTCDVQYRDELDDEQFGHVIAHLKKDKHKIDMAVKKRNDRNATKIKKSHQILYVEQEFVTMDWKCPSVDPRWKDSLSVIALRHPVERIMSEFFYAGPAKKHGMKIDKDKLYKNKDYTQELSNFIVTHVPLWMKNNGSGPNRFKRNDFQWFLAKGGYMDNFQLRALSGCASGECLKKLKITEEKRKKMQQGFNSTVGSNVGTNPACSFFFHSKGAKCDSFSINRICPNNRAGPCFYPAAAWGELGQEDFVRGISALESFDAVLLTEKLGHYDQSAFLADFMGVPQDADFSIGRSRSTVKKTSEREITHFYRDILSNMTMTQDVSRMLHDENRLEMDFYEHATKLNTMMIDEWKRETNWNLDIAV